MDSKRIWCIRAGAASEADSIFLQKEQIAISSTEVDDDARKLPPARTAFKDAYSHGGVRVEAIPISAGQLYRFVHEVSIGDNLIYPRKIDRTLRWGEIVGPYVYDPEGLAQFSHRRSVKWFASQSRDSFSQGALYELGSVLTLFEIKSFAEEFRERFNAPRPTSLNRVIIDSDETESVILRDIEETTRDFISKRLKTDLKGYALEAFVADLFRSMGYRAEATRGYKDNGVDVIAHRDELGIEPPILKIQVKAHNANIGSDMVKAFYAMVQERDVGIFITTSGFTAAAAEFARPKGNLKLIDGVGFIQLIQKYYDLLDQKYRQIIPLRRILVPDVPNENEA